ncbi:MAG: AAA family ATPase [Chloroflexi bacterium]|nr:AAA family ATPase [Chloroflexota bacterium]
MQFRIANTFTDSLARLSTQDQSIAKQTAFDLQTDPGRGGHQVHPIQGAADRNFRSARVNRDIRIIFHQRGENATLCYVAHHDDAYDWAQKRKLEAHPRTGAAQLVEIRETIEEVRVPHYVQVIEPLPPNPPLFGRVSDEELLSYGVPEEWLEYVRGATEDNYLEVSDHLPEEAAEALLQLATGGTPQAPLPITAGTDPFEHPDALRRFRVMRDIEELQKALEYPWEKWSVFLHPDQRAIVERNYNGPARVSGSAGTGKTVVALHRSVFLARSNPDARVLLTTFSDTLASALRSKLRVLITGEPELAERIEVGSLDSVAIRLYRTMIGEPQIATDEAVVDLIHQVAGKEEGLQFSPSFLVSEWQQVVDAWGLATWEDYRDVQRLGRRRRLPETQRKTLWSVFKQVRAGFSENQLITRSDLYRSLAKAVAQRRNPVFEYAVVDESQDLDIGQLDFLAALGGDRPDGLFFAGDLGQRIFQQPFSWLSVGVDIRGRSQTLRVNYRTSHQIRTQADLLLGPELADVDGITERRSGTISVFNGPTPAVHVYDSESQEIDAVAKWIIELSEDGMAPSEIGVFVRSESELRRATRVAEAAGLKPVLLQGDAVAGEAGVAVGTMHLAKGLEFRAVAAIACDAEVIPSRERMALMAEDSDFKDAYNTERYLLYVACTRARDQLLVTGVIPASDFLEDMQM